MHLETNVVNFRRAWIRRCLWLLLLAQPQAFAAHGPAEFEDPLDHPAVIRTHPADRPLMAVARAGARLVAVGMRGLIVVSDDEGKSWTQARVPVQSDLLAVQFPSASEGWVVGHDGVILHSGDAGASWDKQFDGRLAAEQFKHYYENLAGLDDTVRKSMLSIVQSDFQAGPSLPFLDVWFEDGQHGYAVGSYGMIAATADGGKSWQPWMHHIDNDQSLNLNSIRGVGGNLYIAGEQGMVYKLDRASGRFGRVATGYPGSFFGMIGVDRCLLAFGLRGTAYRSLDAGASWQPAASPTQATFTGGVFGEAPRQFLLVTDTGQVVAADDAAQQLHLLSIHDGPLTGVLPVGAASVLLVGLDGARIKDAAAAD